MCSSDLDALIERFRAAPAIAARLALIEHEVTAGTRTPAAAACLLLAEFLREPLNTTDRKRRG